MQRDVYVSVFEDIRSLVLCIHTDYRKDMKDGDHKDYGKLFTILSHASH